MHVASGARKGDRHATSGVGASVETALNTAHVHHTQVASGTVKTTFDHQLGAVGRGVSGAVGCWAGQTGGSGTSRAAALGRGRQSDDGSLVVHGQTAATTTVFTAVTRASREAVTQHTIDRRAVSSESVRTIALRLVLEACERVSLALTVLDASLDGHGVAVPLASAEGAVAVIVGTTADVGPTKVGNIGGVGGGSSDSSVVAAVAVDNGLGRSPLDWVATWKGVEGAHYLLINLWGDDTGLTLSSGKELKNVTVLDQTSVAGAAVSSVLKDVDIPAVDEVTVESVSSWVTLGEDEWLLGTVPPVKPIGRVDDLVEDGNHVDWVRSRAGAVVVGVLGWVSHVRLVIGRIKVDTVPAGWEEDLSTKTVWAGLVRQVVALGGSSTVIKADERNGLAGKVVGVCTLEWVTSNHAESLREGSQVVVVWSTTLTVRYG